MQQQPQQRRRLAGGPSLDIFRRPRFKSLTPFLFPLLPHHEQPGLLRHALTTYLLLAFPFFISFITFHVSQRSLARTSHNTLVEFQPTPPDRAATCLLSSSSMFSFGLRSRLGEGHPHTLTLLFSHFAAVLEACLGSLATCKTLFVIQFLTCWLWS